LFGDSTEQPAAPRKNRTTMVGLLEDAVAVMHDRAAQFGGITRTFTPSILFPFLVVLVDEMAFITAYQPDRDLRKRAEAAIATLTSQGRSVGVCVVGALQDPRKDVISLQRRLAPHVHIAIRGTISRAELREVIAATYHQVWWPSTERVVFDGGHLPVWDNTASTYLDPESGEVLPTWDDAIDTIGDQDEPLHVARFGDRFDAQGVLVGSKDASRCIGYLTKYLTKNVADCHKPDTDAQVRHAERLADSLRYEPCSPTCANWLRYGIQPKNAKPGMMPGRCKGKAHRADHLGYAGRRVLVSRKWSGKTLADHRADRKTWLMDMLDLPATDPTRYTWEPVTPSDDDHIPTAQRLLHVVADRIRWQQALDQARRRAQGQPPGGFPATGEAA
jgi:hypothetical protein